MITAEVLPPDAGPARLSLTIGSVHVGGRDWLLATALVHDVSDRGMSGVPVIFAASGDGCSYSFPHDLTSDAHGEAVWMVDAQRSPVDSWCTITASAGSYTSVYPVRIAARDAVLGGIHLVVALVSRE